MREMIKKNETEITFITQLNAKNINKTEKKLDRPQKVD